MLSEHIIKQGETTISLSEQFGFFSNTIWNDSANAKLKNKRKNMNVLMPGDKLVIPDKTTKEESKVPEKLHRFRRKGVPAKYRLQLFDIEEPRSNQDYRFVVDGKVIKGKTDANGVLDEWVPTKAGKGELFIGDPAVKFEIDFGHLDPITEVVGVQKRLNNIGYDCGEPDGEQNEETKQALLDFQKRMELDETGEPDDATRKKLEEVHDAPNKFTE